MKRLLLLASSAILYGFSAFAQTTLFTETFESAPNVETSEGLNHFIVGICAGNGAAQTGVRAAYIAPNINSAPDCNNYSSTYYGYHQETTQEEVSLSFTLQVACAQNMELSFDYRKNAADLATIYYRVVGTASWTQLFQLNNSASWTSISLPLPNELNNENIEIKFSVTNSAFQANIQPLAIDNISVTGSITAIPQLTCPTSYSYNTGQNCTPIIPNLTGVVTVDDVCPAFVTFTQSPTPGTIVAPTTTVTVTMTDYLNQSNSCSFTANAVDIGAPMLTCPPTVYQAKDANCTATMIDRSNLITGIDNCSSWEDVVLSFNIPVGTPLTNQSTLIIATATDALNNEASCQFTIELIDQTPPDLLNCPPSVSIYREPDCSAIAPNILGNVSAVDNCAATSVIFISQSPAINETIENLTHMTIHAQDESGNVGTCIVPITFLDTIAPTINCSTPVVVTPTSECDFIIPNLQALIPYSDNCPASELTFTQSIVAGTIANSLSAVYVSVTDQYNNTSGCVVEVVPVDTQTPTITCPPDISVFPSTDCSATLANYITVTAVLDNCSNFTTIQAPAPGTILPAGDHIITMTVTDVGANTASCTFTVSVEDNLPAVISCPNNIEQCASYVEYNLPTISGTCNGTITNISSHSYTSGMDFPIGTTTIIYTVQDAATAPQCSFTVTINDPTVVATVLNDTVFVCDQNTVTIEAQMGQNGFWSILGSSTAQIQTPSEYLTAVNGLSIGQHRFVWTVNNGVCGISQDTMVVINNQPPTVSIASSQAFACNNNYFTVSAVSTNGGTWTANTAATFINPTLSQTSVYNMETGWNVLYFTSNTVEGCSVGIDSIRVFRSGELPFPELDSIFCYTPSLMITLPTISMEGIVNTTWSSNFSTVTQDVNGLNFGGLKIGANEFTLTIQYTDCPSRVQKVNIQVEQCEELNNELLMNLITPNGDGKNDEFTLEGLEVQFPGLELIIHDRWGSIVFEGIGLDAHWQGQNPAGDKVPAGVYYYTIKLNDASNQLIKGSISVMY